mgnify:CR=1 FL=1
MPKILSEHALTRYRREGFHFPVRVLSAAQARSYRDRLEAHERATGGPISGNMRHKVHLLFTWADELVRHPAVLDAVEDVIGPDILCWSTSFFIKEARSTSFVSWHQDSTYWGLSTSDVITAWIALSDVPPASGPMIEPMRRSAVTFPMPASPPNMRPRPGIEPRALPTREIVP